MLGNASIPGTLSAPVAATAEAVIDFWKDFDFEATRSGWDADALKIAENQENSAANRRKLMEATRDFKKTPESDRGDQVLPLLKSYQEEVDNLTKRGKLAENAFLTIFQKLYDAPDPAHALLNSADNSARLQDLEQDSAKLRRELEEYREESGKLKNQEVTVRRLEERNRALEAQVAALTEDAAKEKERMALDAAIEKEKSLAEENQKYLEAMREREAFLLGQVEQANGTIAKLRQSHEISENEVFALKSQRDEDRAAKQSELDLLTEEVHNAEQQQQALERDKERMRQQLAALQEELIIAQSADTTSPQLEATRNELKHRESAIEQLKTLVEDWKAAAEAANKKYLQTLRESEAKLAEKDTEISGLHAEMVTRPTPAEAAQMQQKIRTLQAVGYNAVELDSWDEDSPEDAQAGMPLEEALLKKNRSMEHELTSAKNRLQEQTAAAERAEGRALKAETRVGEQQKLIQKLEEDLRSSGKGRLQGSRTWQPSDGLESSWDDENGKGNESSTRSAGPRNEDTSMVIVLAQQRDRFRSKAIALEEENRRISQSRDHHQNDVAKLQAENLALFEKLRFVQNYQPGTRGEKDLEAAGSNEVLSKYSRMYEGRISPFAEFSKREKDRSMKELRVHDRITLSSGRFLLGNKYTRAFLFIYSISLHLLVFGVLWSMSLSSMNRATAPSHEEICSRQQLIANAARFFQSADEDHNGLLDKSEFDHAMQGKS